MPARLTRSKRQALRRGSRLRVALRCLRSPSSPRRLRGSSEGPGRPWASPALPGEGPHLLHPPGGRAAADSPACRSVPLDAVR
jgi:hypothetical protein